MCRRENSQACRSADYDRVFLAIETFDNEELKALTKEGVSLLDPSCLDKFENTPLMAAVMVNNKKIVQAAAKAQGLTWMLSTPSEILPCISRVSTSQYHEVFTS